MDFDLEDAHPTLREKLLEDEEYIRTQDVNIVRFFKKNGVNAEYKKPKKPVLKRPVN